MAIDFALGLYGRAVAKLAVTYALVCALHWAWAQSARADGLLPPVGSQPVDTYEPKPAWAMLAGTATAIVPMAIAGPFFGNTFSLSERRGATLGMMTDLTLAPVVSHLMEREWSRAAIFGLVPLVCLIGQTVLLEMQPSSDEFGSKGGRLAFGLLMSFATLSSGIGIIDSLGAKRRFDEQRAARHASAIAVPIGLPGGGGLAVGGKF